MKKMKRIFALLIAMVMVLGMSTSVFAAGEGTITIKPPTGVDSSATNSYKIYKVFDADGNGNSISYKVKSTKSGVPDVKAIYDADTSLTWDPTTVDHFILDAAGNVHYGTETTDSDGKVIITDSTATELPEAAIAAITAYVTEADLLTTVTSTGTANAVAEGVENGYYFITTSTGTVVTIDSTNPNATVEDKNTVPSVDKKITGATSIDEDGKKALAQVGTTVSYSAEITIGKGAKGYIFHDTMENGLTYNNDAAVTGVTSGATTYTVGKSGTDTFTITFSDDYINTLEVGSKLTVTYSATVNNDAITVDPLNNTAYLNYGDTNSNNKTPESEADVYEAKITVTKKDGENAPLANAGFVIKNASGKYYKLTKTTTGEGANAVTTSAVTWVDTEADATEYKSDSNGAVNSFTGLANGTYTLVEKTVPSGYNRAADITFTISEHDYTPANLEQTATAINKKGSELPSTGGIGTTIFYAIGAVLVIGAGTVLVTRRRMNAQ